MSAAYSVDGDLQRTVAAATRFYGDATSENSQRFDDTLKVLVQAVSSIERAGRISSTNSSLLELLNYCPSLLTSSSTPVSTRSKLSRFLFNISLHNVAVRRYLCADMEMCSPVWSSLKFAIQNQLGPQNMIDILKLMQILTYEKCLVLGIWTNDLISFLISEVIKEPETEWMPFCMAILCNLTCRSKSAGNRIRKSTNYRTFSKRMIRLLQHDSRMVVVSGLVLIGFLDEKIRDVVYSPQNMPPTFQCVFNVLILGDSLLTRHIACDLLKRLVVSDAPTISSSPLITNTGKDLMCYSYFEKCIQQTASLLISIDSQEEEAGKIYDLLLSLCALSQMRLAVCEAILKAPPMEGRLTTPILAMARAARMNFDDVIDAEMPIKAIKMLIHVLKVAADSNLRIADYIPCEHLVQIVDQSVKTTVDASNERAREQCQIIVEGLRLAEVLSSDEDIRNELLHITSSQLCAHISENQLVNNAVVSFINKAPSQRTETVSEWSIHGVSIVLELLRLLAALKDYSKAHKDQYWKSLKDERLVPFLAYAIAYGDHQMVYDALILYTHCSQVQAFPSRWLGDLVASCSINKQRFCASSLNNSRDFKKSSDLDVSSERMRTPENQRCSDPHIDGGHVDELLERLRKGLDIRDVKMSEVLGAYDAKMVLMQRRERELEALVSAKDAALSQSERLRVQFRNGQGSSESDLARIRGLVSEQEKLTENINQLEKQLADVQHENEFYKEEYKKEQHLTAQLREGKEEFRKKFDVTSRALLDKQEHCTLLIREKQNLQDELKSTLEQHSLLISQRESEIQEIRRHLSMIEKRETEGIRCAQEYKERIEAEIAERGRVQEECRRSWERKMEARENEHREYKEATEAELNKLREGLNFASSEGDRAKQDVERMKKLKEEMLRIAGGF